LLRRGRFYFALTSSAAEPSSINSKSPKKATKLQVTPLPFFVFSTTIATMAKFKVTSLVKGSYILHKDKPQQVLSTAFHHPGRGGGVCVVKMRNLLTGATLEETFKSNEQIEMVDLQSREMQFLYQDGTDLVFMDPRSFDQVSLSGNLLEGKTQLLTPDVKVYVLFDEDQRPLAVTLPPKVTLTVTQAPEAVAGNTVNAAKKTVTLETGLEVLAPLFIKTGEKIVVDTDTMQYFSRA